MNIFKKKITIINNKWEHIKSKYVSTIPNINELIFMDSLYYMVVNVVHDYDKKKIIVIIERYADYEG